MLIEDDVFAREDLCSELTSAGHDVVVHSGGHAALKSIVSDPPHVIVTDIVMDDGEGMDLISKTRERYPNVGVIAISSNQEYLKYAAALGAHHTMHKPFKLQVLLQKIETITGEMATA